MKTLVLNLDYTPLNIINIRRALNLAERNRVKVLVYYDLEFKSEKMSHKVPAVILYEKYVYRFTRRSPTRFDILNRDQLICQYCSAKMTIRSATIDHIKPVSYHKNKKSANTWENMVACCQKCNIIKKDRTPSQAGMSLIKNPKKPYNFLLQLNIPNEWEEFAVKTC